MPAGYFTTTFLAGRDESRLVADVDHGNCVTECHNLVISEFEKGPLRRLIATKELLVREVLGRINVQDPREGLVRFLCATQGFCGRLRKNARERGELA